MPVYVSLLRGINVGGHQQMKMDTLRAICADIGFERVQTYIQSGNLIFQAREKDGAKIARRLQKAIEASIGFGPDVILRTRSELDAVLSHNPFAGRKDIAPNKLLVTFFDRDPVSEGIAQVNAMKVPPEEFKVVGRELYVYYPEGSGRSKFPAAAIHKTLKASGTARNWNTVLKLLEMATKAEGAG